MVTLELLIDASVWDHSTLLLTWEHTWLTFSFISSSHLPYHSSTSTLHLHQILHFWELLSSISPNSVALHLLLIILHGFPSSPHQGRPSPIPISIPSQCGDFLSKWGRIRAILTRTSLFVISIPNGFHTLRCANYRSKNLSFSKQI